MNSFSRPTRRHLLRIMAIEAFADLGDGSGANAGIIFVVRQVVEPLARAFAVADLTDDPQSQQNVGKFGPFDRVCGSSVRVCIPPTLQFAAAGPAGTLTAAVAR